MRASGERVGPLPTTLTVWPGALRVDPRFRTGWNVGCRRTAADAPLWSERSLRGKAGSLDVVGSRRCIPMEDLNGFARVFSEIFSDEIKLAQQVVGHRNNVAAALLGVEDVQQLARARPKQLRLRPRGRDLLARLHMRDWIDTGIGDATGENRNDRRCCRMQRVDNHADLIERENRGHVKHHALRRQRASW